MPTPRFQSLPKEKQDRITQALIDEFAELGMDEASVSGIVKRAGIPRGSFYQYFANLSDSMDYVHTLIMHAKQSYLAECLALVGKAPFFDFLSVAFSKSLDFVAENPKYAQIGSHLLTCKDGVTKKIVVTARQQGEKFYADLIQLDKAKGLIREDVDPTLVARLIMPLFLDLTVKLLYEDNMEASEIKRILNWALEIVKKGVMV